MPEVLWTKLKGLQEQRAAKADAMKKILDTGEAEKRDLSEAEVKSFDDLRAEIEKIDPEIERLETLREIGRSANVNGNGRPGRDAIGVPETGQADARSMFSPLKGEWEKRIAVRNGTQQNSEPLSITKCIRGSLYRDWADADAERRAMSTTGDGSGLLPLPVSANLIQGMWNSSVLARAGALTIPVDTAQLKVARISSLPVPAWKAENAVGAVSQPGIDSITFTPKTLFVSSAISLELASDSANSDPIIMQSLSQAMGLAMDAAGLFGSGTNNDPVGISNTSGIQTMTGIGNLTSYANFSTAIQRLAEVNATANAIVLSPNSQFTLDRLVDSLGQPLRRPDSVANLPFLNSNQIPIWPATVSLTGSPTGGSLAISVTAGGSTQTASGISYNASTATVQTAIQGLSNVGTGNATVTGSAGAWVINFAGSVGRAGAVKVTADGSGLTGGTSPAASVSAVTSGFVGDFSKVLIGLRQQVFIEQSRESHDGTQSAWASGQIHIRAILRADIQLAHPQALMYLSGINVS